MTAGAGAWGNADPKGPVFLYKQGPSPETPRPLKAHTGGQEAGEGAVAGVASLGVCVPVLPGSGDPQTKGFAGLECSRKATAARSLHPRPHQPPKSGRAWQHFPDWPTGFRAMLLLCQSPGCEQLPFLEGSVAPSVSGSCLFCLCGRRGWFCRGQWPHGLLLEPSAGPASKQGSQCWGTHVPLGTRPPGAPAQGAPGLCSCCHGPGWGGLGVGAGGGILSCQGAGAAGGVGQPQIPEFNLLGHLTGDKLSDPLPRPMGQQQGVEGGHGAHPTGDAPPWSWPPARPSPTASRLPSISASKRSPRSPSNAHLWARTMGSL